MIDKAPTIVDQIIYSLENEPQAWRTGNCTLIHNKGIELWIANVPFFDLGIYSPKRSITWREKWALWKAVKKWNKSPLFF